VITGFNTDVEHGGVVYHVQTEDKGLKSPLILSLVYVGGTIIASRRTPYDDLIAEGFEEDKLAERLQRQHKLICAAIHAGRVEELKRQSERAKPPEQEQEQKNEAVPETAVPEATVPEEVTQEAVAQEIAEEDADIFQHGSLADFMPPSIFMTQPAPPSEPVEAAPATPETNEAPSSH
jgi:hypothetical protein